MIAVQTKDGFEPGNVVGSELAAMFSLQVLPTLKQHYVDPDDPSVFEQHCKDFAATIGLPKHRWPMVTFPSFISIDNDPRHGRVRQLLSVPRVEEREVARFRRHAYEEIVQVGTDIPDKLVSAYAWLSPTPQAGATDLRKASGRLAGYDELVERASGRRPDNTFRDSLKDYIDKTGYDPADRRLWDRARIMNEYVCVFPWQYMPLTKIAPDIHQPPEHMVGKVKRFVTPRIQQMDMNDPAMWKGKTFQALLTEAVAEVGNGEGGLHHIQGSVRKQPHCCKILAADKDVDVIIHHKFAGREEEHHVIKGTAGDYIRDQKWN